MCDLWGNKTKIIREQLFQLLSHFIWDHLHLNKFLQSSCQCLPSILMTYFFLQYIKSMDILGNGGRKNSMSLLAWLLGLKHHLFRTSSICLSTLLHFQYIEQLLTLIHLFVNIVYSLRSSLLKLAFTIALSHWNNKTCKRHWQRVLPHICGTFCSSASQISYSLGVLWLSQE